MNYLKAFLLEYLKKDIREYFDVVVVRGQWDATLAAPMPNAYQELLKISAEITEFDSSLAEYGSSGLKIKNLLPKTAHDPGAENIINRVVSDANEQARSYLISLLQIIIVNYMLLEKQLNSLLKIFQSQNQKLFKTGMNLKDILITL